jgi:hypothetical protein
MFKSQEQVATFMNLLEKFTNSAIHYAALRNQGLDEAAKQTAAILNKDRDGLEAFITLACGITPASDMGDPEPLMCPDCGAEMALRTNRQNGNKFWGCRKYPSCRGTRDEDGLSRAEREEAKYKKEQAVQEGGFSFNRDKRNPVTEVTPPVQDTGWVNPFAKK